MSNGAVKVAFISYFYQLLFIISIPKCSCIKKKETRKHLLSLSKMEVCVKGVKVYLFKSPHLKIKGSITVQGRRENGGSHGMAADLHAKLIFLSHSKFYWIS